jgi:hypothetical protein
MIDAFDGYKSGELKKLKNGRQVQDHAHEQHPVTET